MVSEKTKQFFGKLFLWGGIGLASILILTIIWRNADPCGIGDFSEQNNRCEFALDPGKIICPEGSSLVAGQVNVCISEPRKNGSLYILMFVIGGIVLFWFFGRKMFTRNKFQSAESIKSISPKQACIAYRQYYEQTFGKQKSPYLVEPMTTYFKNAKDGKSYEVCDARAYFHDGTYLEPTLPLYRGEEAIRQGHFQQNKGHFFFFDQNKHRNMIPNQTRDQLEVLEKMYDTIDPDYLRKLHAERIAKNVLQEDQEKKKE